MSYQKTIRESLERRRGVMDTDPRHIEAWMRLENGCLDGLSPVQFSREISISLRLIAATGAAESEELAQSMGL